MLETAALIHPLRLGRLLLAGNLVLAPMHHHSHLALRLLCRREGAALAHTEMVTPEDLLASPGRKADHVLASTPQDRPLGVQLLPRDAGPLAESVAMLAERGAADLVDLNFACPSRRVVADGRGGALLRRADLALELVEAAVRASPLAVTVKMRLGFTDAAADRDRALAIARDAASAGAAAVTLHARTVGQGYGGRADWTAIARWAERLPIPVFGSGDLRSAEAVLAMLRQTCCAGAGIARGALGAPWIFRQVRERASGKIPAPVERRERRETLLEHFDGLAAQFGEDRAVRLMRVLGKYYARGIPGAPKARAALQAADSAAAFRRTIDEWFQDA